MNRKLAAGIAACALAFGVAAEQPAPIQELETVLVIGEQPGPGLWKVTKGDHVMWVLAGYSPLPRDMTWRSTEVEARIAESQQVLYPGTVDMRLDLNLVRVLTMIPTLLKVDDMPDGAKLQDVLAPATYEKWSRLREKYLGHPKRVERMRPTFAIEELRAKAYRKSNLQGGPSVHAVVNAAAKKHEVPIRRLRTAERTVRVGDFKRLVKNMNRIGVPDVECFTLSLAHLEPDLERMRVFANAWARGDVERLRELGAQPEFGTECENVLELATLQDDVVGTEQFRKLDADYSWHAEQAGVQVKREWLAAARGALNRNRSTFAVLPVREVVGATGYLAELKKLGYEVEEP